jgi:hypothetical protein
MGRSARAADVPAGKADEPGESRYELFCATHVPARGQAVDTRMLALGTSGMGAAGPGPGGSGSDEGTVLG